MSKGMRDLINYASGNYTPQSSIEVLIDMLAQMKRDMAIPSDATLRVETRFSRMYVRVNWSADNGTAYNVSARRYL